MTPRRVPILLAGVLYTVVMAGIAIVAAWPVYADARFVVLGAAAVASGLALAAAARAWGWRPWLVLLAALGAFVVLGVGIAVPPDSSGSLLASVRDLATGAVTGFKDLLTVDLPVGDYRNLLVPALVVMLAGTLGMIVLAWRDDRLFAAAAFPALGMLSFGLLFGRSQTSEPFKTPFGLIPAPVEIACGAAALVATVAWLAWRTHEERRAALNRAAHVSGVRVSRRRSVSDRRRRALAAGMIVTAVAVAAVVSPAVAASRDREVLRSGIGPALDLSRAVSPLTQYRANFADDAVADALFRVKPISGAPVERIRLATLTSYDGAIYRVADPAGVGADARFTRVASRLETGPGTESVISVEIESLRGVWLPTFGELAGIEFTGADAARLSDAFYYNRRTDAGVQTARGGLRAGDTYTLTGTVAAGVPLESLQAPGAKPPAQLPDSVKTWMQSQDAGTGGAALRTLVDRLRERGYLSHALIVPADGAQWLQTLGEGYTFQPSASGHSLGRIDTMFQKLLQRQSAAADEGSGASEVAAVGDDEQFAVAAALIAAELGFPARVVVGVRLAGADEGVPPCADGVCTGANVAVWLEVATRDGAWVPVDVTPQHEAGVQASVTRERDPKVPTQVRPEAAWEVVAPEPVQGDADNGIDREDSGLDSAALWAVLRVAAMTTLAIAVVAGPLLVIVAAKALRRRARRRARTPTARIVGGWDEYVDAAVDHGAPPPHVDTRTELAARYETRYGGELAVLADRVVFAGAPGTPDESDRFWRIVDAEREEFARSRSLWRRIRAAVSLNSFTRELTSGSVRGRTSDPRRTERRGRRFDDDAR